MMLKTTSRSNIQKHGARSPFSCETNAPECTHGAEGRAAFISDRPLSTPSTTPIRGFLVEAPAGEIFSRTETGIIEFHEPPGTVLVYTARGGVDKWVDGVGGR